MTVLPESQEQGKSTLEEQGVRTHRTGKHAWQNREVRRGDKHGFFS
jgi:hypothetical protein